MEALFRFQVKNTLNNCKWQFLMSTWSQWPLSANKALINRLCTTSPEPFKRHILVETNFRAFFKQPMVNSNIYAVYSFLQSFKNLKVFFKMRTLSLKLNCDGFIQRHSQILAIDVACSNGLPECISMASKMYANWMKSNGTNTYVHLCTRTTTTIYMT